MLKNLRKKCNYARINIVLNFFEHFHEEIAGTLTQMRSITNTNYNTSIHNLKVQIFNLILIPLKKYMKINKY